MNKIKKSKIRYNIFLPSFILIICTIIFSMLDNTKFIEITTYAKDMMITKFGWLFSITGIICLLCIVLAYFSPLGNIKIGGKNASPFMKKSSCVFIILCTTIAAGILFWGTSEPIYHLSSPPESLGIKPFSPQAAKYAMETMYLHWTFMPYAFYTVPAIVFAFAYYNMKRPFSIGSQISPLLKNRKQDKFDMIVDIVILFAISFAIASSFATSIMNVGGGLNELLNIPNDKTLWIIIAIIGTIAFIISSGSGLFKGIKILSNINIYIYFIILLVLLILGPSTYMLSGGTEAFGGFLTNLFDKALFTGAFAGDPWPKDWTTFYWSNWMAWAPVTAIFLARLCYGYTLKEVIVINFVLPSLFSTAWMTILSGIAINFQMNGVIDLVSIINEKGYGSATYAILQQFPLSNVLIAIYIFAVFISFVTATDSTVNAMASISTSGISDGEDEAPLIIKILWGSIVGVVSIIFISSLGIDGIKMLSYLGGIPALFLGILSVLSLFVIIKKHKELDLTESYSNSDLTEDYRELGVTEDSDDIN